MSMRYARERAPTGGEHTNPKRKIGRYTFHTQIASGGMATVFLGRLSGQVGFSKTVAIKRPHPHLIGVTEFANMFVDEARLAARIQHPNVVATLDVVANESDLFLVMDYVHGESLSHLLSAAKSKNEPISVGIACSIIVNVLHGLHAAHEAVDEHGEPLGIVHRDVSPQNVIVGVDGVARVLDFGVAKAAGRLQSTSEGQLKGKVAYMAPEQVKGAVIDRRTDVYAAAALLWGALTGRKLIDGENEAELLNRILNGKLVPPSTHAPSVPPELDAIVMRGIARDPAERFATAREMAIAIESAVSLLSPYQVGEWVKSLAAAPLARREQLVREMESASEVSLSRRVATGTVLPADADADADAVVDADAEGPPPVDEEPPRSLAMLVAVAAAVSLLTFGGAFAWFYSTVHDNTPAPDPAPTVRVVPDPRAAASSTTTTPSSAATAPSAAPSAVELDPPEASAEKAPTSAPKTSPTSRPHAGTMEKPAANSKPKTSKSINCESSPFFVDDHGIKRVRPECS